jgi:hypothetical protein
MKMGPLRQMNEIERVTALMSTSSQRWESLRLEGHEWRALDVFRRAWDHHFAESAMGSPLPRSIDLATSASRHRASETTEKWRIWLWKPDRVRTEFQVGDDIVKAVMLGDHWWSWSARGFRTNQGDPSSRHGVGPAEGLINTAHHVASLELQPRGRVTFRSRSAVVVIALPRHDHKRGSDLTYHLLGTGAETYKLLVDAEIGIILRSEAEFQGQAFRVIEVDEVGVNEPLDEAIFAAPG